MTGWWNLMQKYEGEVPGKLYHQGMMAVDPDFAGSGIGAKIAALTEKKLAEAGYDGVAVETSSKSADQLVKKLRQDFSVYDVDTSDTGLTLRLHLRQTEMASKIYDWFLAKKEEY